MYEDHDFNEQVAVLFNPIGLYTITIPSRHLQTVKHIDDQLIVTELTNAYLIPSQTVKEKKDEWRKRNDS